MRCRFAECCCCDAHTIQRLFCRGWLAFFSINRAGVHTHLTNQLRDRKMNAQRISQRTFTCRGDSGSFYFQSSSPPSSGGTYCMCIRFLSFWCMCIAHLNHSKPGKLGIIFRAPPSSSYSKRGEELAGEVTVLVLHECGVQWYYHNSESSLLNPLIQSQEDIITNWSTSLIPSPICIGC